MYRIFIVDDRPMELRVLKEIIDWSGIGIEIAGVFSNGRQALEKAAELKPHIVLTDIAMPVMNGIELARSLKDGYPDTKVIFLSCYEDFTYAKSAIELNICGYVLKPVVPEELMGIILKAVDDLEASHQQKKQKEEMLEQIKTSLPLVQEQFIKDLLLGNFNDFSEINRRAEFLELKMQENSLLWVLYIGISNEPIKELDADIADRYFVNYAIKKTVNSFSNENVHIYAIQITDREYAALALYKRSPGNSAYNHKDILDSGGLMEIFENIYNEITGKLNYSISIGLSKSADKLMDIPKLYKQALSAEKTKFFSNKTPIILFEEIEDIQYADLDEKINMETLFREIKSLISYGPEDEIMKFILKYYEAETVKPSEIYFKSLTFTIVNITVVILMEAGENFKNIFGSEAAVWEKLNRFETILDIKQWLLNMFRAIKEHLEAKNSDQNSKVIESIKKVIRERYNRNLTIGDISKQIFLSPGYCNSLFKRETGMTIGDYLTDFRMEKAKELLRDSEVKVASVAEMVGYENKSYFALLFRKTTGLTPAKYKSSVII